MDEPSRWRMEQAEAWLLHVRGLGRRVRSLQAEIEAQREAMEGVRSTWGDGMPKAPGFDADAIPDAVARLRDLLAAYAGELQGYVEEQHDAHVRLREIEVPELVQALTGYYLLGKSWELCCVEMGYSWNGMMALRRRALLRAYDHMPHWWRDRVHPAI